MHFSVNFVFRSGIYNFSLYSQPLQDASSTVTGVFYLLQSPAYFPTCIGIQLACVFTSLKSMLKAAIFLTVCVTSHAGQSEYNNVPR